MTTWNSAAVQAYLKAQALALWGLVVAVVTTGYTLGAGNGGFNDWPTFVTYASHAWFGVAMGFVFGVGPLVHAKASGDAATMVVKGPNSTSIPNTLVNPELIPPVGTPAPKGQP